MSEQTLTVTYAQTQELFIKAMDRLNELELVWQQLEPVVKKLRQVVYQDIPERRDEQVTFEQFKVDVTTWLDKFAIVVETGESNE